MKIALCLFGMTGGNAGVGGLGKKIHPKNGFKYYYKNLLSLYDVDVFVHSWSTEFKKEILNLYNPKKYIIEPQKPFDNISLPNFGYNKIQDLRKLKTYKAPYSEFNDNVAFKKFETLLWRSYSRWYSTYKSIELKKDFEDENNIEYDFVISSRFDIALLKKIKFEKLDKNNFYASFRHNRDDFKEALYDLIFLSTSQKMDSFSKLHENFENFSFRPTWAAREQIENLNFQISEILKYEKDYKLLRWNQNYMKSDFDIFLYIRHLMKYFKNTWLKV